MFYLSLSLWDFSLFCHGKFESYPCEKLTAIQQHFPAYQHVLTRTRLLKTSHIQEAEEVELKTSGNKKSQEFCFNTLEFCEY